MSTLPSLTEATLDLRDVRLELEAMRRINVDANWLATRADVDQDFYRSVAARTASHIVRGSNLEKKILSLYPELL